MVAKEKEEPQPAEKKKPPPKGAPSAQRKRRTQPAEQACPEERIDEALRETFPASDPPAY